MLQTSNSSKKPAQFEQDLDVYPPRLRRLAHFILNSSSDSTTLAEWCQEAGMSYDSIRDAVSKARRKGHDFKHLINQIAYEKLTSKKPIAYKKLMDGVLKGSHKHLELYFRLVSDLKHEPPKDGDTHIKSLTFVLPMPQSINVTVQPTRNEHSAENQDEVIDVEPESSSMRMIEKDPSIK